MYISCKVEFDVIIVFLGSLQVMLTEVDSEPVIGLIRGDETAPGGVMAVEIKKIMY